ncbi:putative leucine-rich repeat-containing protein DDB_G0290503 [Clytia hemisphaerica]|uniref:GRIP domain-containing protein n=1 Tax=Clytia hemisphaerica TaxID=252671 RepID=A0A7M5V577_9CNID
MSWLNLSNIANNVSSFTKEVLTDAAREDDSLAAESDDDKKQPLNDFNPQLRDELLFLRSEVSQKDEHIIHLQDEISRLKTDFEKHSTNLKQHLLEKEEELDSYADKLNQSEVTLNERIDNLVLEKVKLEKELGDKMSASETDNESDWGNDWGGENNDAEVSTLREENESLNNEVSMKEIVLSSIESKMRQLSGGKHLDASEFSDWIDEYLETAKQEQDKATNLTELVLFLKEEINDDSDGYDIDLDSVYDWVNARKEEKVILERKITKLQNTILSIEDNVKHFDKGLQSFQIADFSDWLSTLSSPKSSPRMNETSSINKQQTTRSEVDLRNDKLIKSIEESIREFDDDDSNFRIEEFNSWIEKIQNKIDDLEVELLNEQDLKETDEKLRIDERAKLKEMFDEKEKEIGFLKVELYNKSQQQMSMGEHQEVAPDNSTTLQEQLNETIARCEALQNELESSKDNVIVLELESQQMTEENSKLKLNFETQRSDLKETINDNSSKITQLNELLEKALSDATLVKDENEILKDTLENLKNQDSQHQGELVMELQQAKERALHLETELTNEKKLSESLNEQISVLKNDISSVQMVLENLDNEDLSLGQPETLVSDQELMTSLNEMLQSLSEDRKTLEYKIEDLQEDLTNKAGENEKFQELVIQIIDTISTELFSNQMPPPTITPRPLSKDPAPYTDYIKSVSWHLKKEKDDLHNQQSSLESENEEHQKMIESLNQQIQTLQLENASLPTSENDSLPQETITEYTTQITNLTKDIQDLNHQLENIQQTNADLQSTNNQLQQSLEESKQQSVAATPTILNDSDESLGNSPQSSSGANSGGGVKFGVLKRKIKDLEESNATLQNEIERLKRQQTSDIAQSTAQSEQSMEQSQEETSAMKEELEELRDQNNDLQTYNDAFQREVEQLKMKVEELTTSQSNTGELQENINTLTQQLQQYQTYSTNLQAENEHLKRLSQAAMAQGSDQEVALRMELQNQINVLTHENQHYQNEYESLRQGWIKNQQETSTYMENLQQQYQLLQTEYQQLQQQQKQAEPTPETSIDPIASSFHVGDSTPMTDFGTAAGNSGQMQEKLHNLSLMMTEKAEECMKLQQENDTIKAKLIEIQNDSSDMELIREECKQLKTMLMSKDHEDTISNLQLENKQLKQQIDQIQRVDLEKDNDLSDMELLREECRQLKLMLVNKDSPAQYQALESENTQLEHSLRAKDDEVSQLNASLIEMQNSVSDMDLVREECKQLKLMLMNQQQQSPQTQQQQSPMSEESYKLLEAKLQSKEDELKQKDSIIFEMQNTSGDVELLKQQCEQLKSMLSEKENTLNESNLSMINNTEMENSFMVQVKQLEEVMKEKESKITELQNTLSDMEYLQNECRVLKEMITEKETMFGELQNDLDLANNVIEQRHNDLSVKNTECKLLRDQLEEMSETMASKESEMVGLREEMSEAVLQDENIHMLQTEYRNVEEQLKSKEKELQETQERLFNAETHCDRLKVYEEQYQGLKDTLKEKDAELSNLQLQSSESSIFESETVTLMQQELNQLKTLLYEKENELEELRSVLEKKNLKIQELMQNRQQIKNDLMSEQNRVRELMDERNKDQEEHQQSSAAGNVDQLESQIMYHKSMADELAKTNKELSANLKTLESRYHESLAEVDSLKKENDELIAGQKQLQQALFEAKQSGDSGRSSPVSAVGGGVKFGVLKRKIKELEDTNATLQNEILSLKQHGPVVSPVTAELTNTSNNSLSDSEYQELLSEKQSLLEQFKQMENQLKVTANALQDQTLENQQLQTYIQQSEQNHKEALEQMNSQNNENQQSTQSLNQEKQIIDTFVNNLRNLLQMSSTSGQDSTNEFGEITQQVQQMVYTLQQKDTLLAERSNEVTNLSDQIRALGEAKSNYEFRMTDLQSQLLEYQELVTMYKAKCTECENLQSSLQQTSSQLQQGSLQTSEESDHLRDELTKNSHSLLAKNRECDDLKLEILKLEEKVFNQEQSLNQVQGVEGLHMKIQELNVLCQRKEQENQQLQSQLEDNQAVFENSKKEKAFIDQLLREKGTLETERNELVFQRDQLTNRLQEQDVELKHNTTNTKEVEVKTKRELERLRNHLMMIEENHTKDILECQQREDTLRAELDEARETLGKKSIILQDSSKQFQEHVGTLEEQLHTIAAQRDANTFELDKSKHQIERDASAIYNLQNALEQLQREKDEQYEYLVSVDQKKVENYESRLDELMQEQEKAQVAMSEASLAVQGIAKLNLELEQKDRELQASNEKAVELSTSLQERDLQYNKILQASDGKMEKSLIRNLLEKYFQAPEDKRGDIVKVIGGLLGMSHDQIKQIGTGAAPSKVGGWISNVWGYAATPSKKENEQAANRPPVDPNQSFSEMFIKFLEHESTNRQPPVDSSASLANAANVPMPANMLMLSSTTPDILAFHNKTNEELNSSSTIPAPGQEIPRVHTHHAQSTLKTLLS